MLSVSVVVTTFNRPRLVLRAVQSVLSQTRAPDEVIVVDDHSPDWPNEGLETLAASIPRLKIIRLDERGGPQVTRNTGARTATGDILMFLDDDDRWAPDKIEVQAKLLEERPELGWVYTGMISIDDRGEPDTSETDREISRSSHHTEGHVWPDILYRNFIGPTSAVAMRRDLFARVGGFDPTLPAMQDFDLWVRLARAAPVAYDGRHALYFSAKSNVSQRVSDAPGKYQNAIGMLIEKYAHDMDARPDVKRRAESGFQILLASKHTDAGNYPRAVLAMARAALLDPGALTRLLGWAGRRIAARLERHQV